MKEVFRIKNGTLRGGMVRCLNLEIYAGEVVLLCGPAGSGILTLLSFLNGKLPLEQGNVYIDGVPAALSRDQSAQWRRIFVNTEGRNQAENLTVAENLQILRHPDTPLRLYREAEMNRAAGALLCSEHVDVDPACRVDGLSERERQLLSLVQAKLVGAGLLVIDATKADMANAHGTELYEMILRMKSEGMAFLILAFHARQYANMADRYLLLDRGRDTYEWQRTRFGGEFPAVGPRIHTKPDIRYMESIEDPWEYELPEGELLRKLQRNHPDYCRKYLNFPVPRKGLCLEKGTVLIPKESAEMLARNLSVRENLVLPLCRRAGRSFLGIWMEPAVGAVHAEFCRRTGTDPEKKHIQDLTLLERKLLSIYRWEVYQPRVMVLHGITYGLDTNEIEKLYQYFDRMEHSTFRVLLCTGSHKAAPLFCASGTESLYARDPHRVDYHQ